jgi:hypothetical protein
MERGRVRRHNLGTTLLGCIFKGYSVEKNSRSALVMQGLRSWVGTLLAGNFVEDLLAEEESRF